MMSTKHVRNRNQRRNHPRPPRPDKRPTRLSPDQIASNLVQQFNLWCNSLRTKSTYEFDRHENNHRCRMTLPIFPNLQSIGNGAKTKKEARANAIIAFLAHMEQRKQVGLFVPYLYPSLLRDIQIELRRANVSTPDLNININEYLLADRIIPKYQAKKFERIMKTLERICNVRIITLWQSTNMTFVYIVGAQSNQDHILPYVKALFQPDSEQMFNYGEKLFDVFSDQNFLDGVCQRLKVLCDNHLEMCKLYIRGSSVNVQCCYNELLILRREFENEIHRNPAFVPGKSIVSTDQNSLKTTIEQLESTRIDSGEKASNEEKESDDQLPDYSVYGDDVNASIMRVLKDEEGTEETKPNPQTNKDQPPVIIEVSDDSSDGGDLLILETIKPQIPKRNISPILQLPKPPQPLHPRPQPTAEFHSTSHAPSVADTQKRALRHIVLDGQNIARNSNDYGRVFSWSRLSNSINYFKNRGHENVIAFLPLYYRDHQIKNFSPVETARERQIRDTLINSRSIAFTPSRYNNGHRLTNYDDRFILQYAADNDGIVVSNDNFRDLQHEPNFNFIISHRILPFATINDTFMPATDPLGRNGPNLDEFLSKPICDSDYRF